MRRAVFLDRDGVINQKLPEGGYITRWDQVTFLPDSAKAVKRIRDAGFFAVLVTNQRAVAKGFLSEMDLQFLHERMWLELFREEKGFDAVYYCPHEKNPPCECRKPRPGMLLRAAQDHGIDLARSWMIGDSESDVLAGKTAGCRTIRLCSRQFKCSSSADEVVESLHEAVATILRTQQ
jgi:D-glycero-D-manno-heptose 1,7-bisphosphate phosphatase